MDPVFLIAFIVLIFVLIIARERYRVSTRQASCYKLARSHVVRELTAFPREDTFTWDVLGYRWRRRARDDWTHYMARMTVTQSALYLYYRLFLVPMLGIPLVLPSYRIPLREIINFHVLGEAQPPAPLRALGSKSMNRLAVETQNGTCTVEFVKTVDIQAVQRALTELI